MDVSYLLVNFNTGRFLPGAIASLMQQDLGGRQAEVVVVDSCSTIDQSVHLAAARAQGARVVQMTENRGYGGGCNRGLRESTGRIVFFLNADVLAGANCIVPLVQVLEEQAEVGLVEPRTYIDPACEFAVPEIMELTRLELLRTAGVRLSAALTRRYVRRRVRRALPHWRATAPMAVRTLSGAFLGSRRETMQLLGGFDEGFPLYYEDSDLFRRTLASGRSLVFLPLSRAVHFAHRSAATVADEAHGKWRRGRDRYIARHLGPFSLVAERLLGRLASGLERRGRRPSADKLVDLGPLREPPVLRWGVRPGPFLLEFAFDSRFLLAAGHLGEGDSHVFSAETWASLRSGEFFMRALDPESLREHGRWRIVKA